MKMQEKKEEGRSRNPVAGDYKHCGPDSPCHLKNSAQLTPRLSNLSSD